MFRVNTGLRDFPITTITTSLKPLRHGYSSIVQKRPVGILISKHMSTAHRKLTGFLVCMNTVPGPVNLQTKPSPEESPEMIPPDATRSRIYFVFQATRWPLSTMYLSPSTSCLIRQLFLWSLILHTNSRLF